MIWVFVKTMDKYNGARLSLDIFATSDIAKGARLWVKDSAMRLHEIINWTRTDLTEAVGRSMARVHSHVQNRSIGLISANLETNTPEENTRARHELTHAAKRAGFGYSHVRG